MPTPPRPDWITALQNSVQLFPEGAPVAAPKRWAAGHLGPSSIIAPLPNPLAPTEQLHRRQAGSPARRTVFVEVADRRIAVRLGLPAAFQTAIAIEPMTSQRRGWNPALAFRAAKTRKVVIRTGVIGKPGPAQRDAQRLQMPESAKCEVSKSGFCESFEHRSPPFPLARQASERDSQLGATIIPHAGQAGAIDPDILRHRWPGHRQGGVAKGGTAHVLFIRVKRLVLNEMSQTIIGK